MRVLRSASAAGLTLVLLGFASAPGLAATDSATKAGAASSGAHALIQGSGSSWAANAVNQWVADVQSQGIQVVYNPDGDASGRQDFASRTSDFAVTSIGYQGRDPLTGQPDTSQGRAYAYLPIAAGGTSFPYQIKIHGVQDTTLRLSGQTLAEIFTDKITNWDNAAITKDNNGHALPSLPIIPVVQSEGSGATAQLTEYFAKQYPSIWSAFTPGHVDTMTEYYPQDPGSLQKPQNGSDGAMNFISSSSANGSIGYVEYSYALSQNYPVAKLLNSAGYYTLPTQYNVAVALEKAQINMDRNSPNYLLQNLDDVYVDKDPRTYPLSSYVYMIEPTGTTAQDPSITTAKRQSIADFEYYSICQGQSEIGPIGYSPLPVNLVEAGFGQLNKLKAADPAVDLTDRNVKTCDNPTFVEGHPSANRLAVIAPLPPSCDKVGAGPCAPGVTPNGAGTDPNKSGTVPGSGNSKSGGGSGPDPSNTQSSSTTGTSGRGGTSGGGKTGTTTTDPGGTSDPVSDGSEPGSASSEGSSPTGTQADSAFDNSPALAGYRSTDVGKILAPIAVVLLIAILVLPPLVSRRLSARRKGGS